MASIPSNSDGKPLAGSSEGVKLPWDEEVDVVVVGFGGAGSIAAIEAAEKGASVLVLERFTGGGATRMSGGVVYAGGGTELQKDGGYDDTPGELFNYLKCETDGEAVSDEVLRSFCESSVDNFKWVEGNGVPYPKQGFPPVKTSYPSNETTLYFSGNEKCPPECDLARPAPRGHRALGSRLTGKVFFEPLRRAALAAGAQVRYRSKATRLITDDKGHVIGLEARTLSSNRLVRALHYLLYSLASHLGSQSMFCLKTFAAQVARLEDAFGQTSCIRVRGGVVLASGGFIYNPEWTRRYIPKYCDTMRLGTMGDDGSGIALGLSVGAGLRKMDRGTAWMFINPPLGFTKGILLDRKGERICNEERYGAALGEAIAEFHEGQALLLLDQKSWQETRDQIVSERKANFQTLMAVINLWFNNTKSHSLEELAAKTGLPSGALRDAVERYNRGVDAECDEMGKSAELLMKIDTPPYYGVDCDLDNRKFLIPSISLGGLAIDGLTSEVQRADGSPIQGLFAAGRTAVGVCSQHYVSGLSIADCVFSGRNAGRSVAEVASRANSTTAH